VRVLNIKETRKTRGGLISEGAYNRMYFFCLKVDGPITGGAYKWGGLYAAVYGMPWTRNRKENDFKATTGVELVTFSILMLV